MSREAAHQQQRYDTQVQFDHRRFDGRRRLPEPFVDTRKARVM